MKKAVLVPYDKYQRLIREYEKNKTDKENTDGTSENEQIKKTSNIAIERRDTDAKTLQETNNKRKDNGGMHTNKQMSDKRIKLVKPPGRPQLKRKTMDSLKSVQSKFVSGWITL